MPAKAALRKLTPVSRSGVRAEAASRRAGSLVPRGLAADVALYLTVAAAFAVPVIVAALVPVAQDDRLRPLGPGWFLLGLVNVAAVVALGETRRASVRFTGVFGSGARLYMAAALACWAAVLGASSAGREVGTEGLAWIWLVSPPVLIVVRAALHRLLAAPPERVLVVGSGVVGRQIAVLARRHPESNVVIVGRVDVERGEGLPGEPEWLGSIEDVVPLLATGEVDRIVVAYSHLPDHELAERLRPLTDLPVQIDVVPRLFDLVSAGGGERIGPLGLVPVPVLIPSRLTRSVKRGLDVAVAGALLALLAVPLLAIAAAIKLRDGGSVFYRQPRMGRGGQTFPILKFRTMVPDADRVAEERLADLQARGYTAAEANDLLKAGDDPRVTKVGNFLRRTSLDELPQLWNVLRGDMSIVGPRPLPLYEARAVEGWHHKRHAVRPGITGLWQVLGRSDTPWEERMALDCRYVQRMSVFEDLRIIARTARAVLGGGGAR